MRWCERCQGNGELVLDWARYMKGEDDEPGVLEECPECDGEGEIEDNDEPI